MSAPPAPAAQLQVRLEPLVEEDLSVGAVESPQEQARLGVGVHVAAPSAAAAPPPSSATVSMQTLEAVRDEATQAAHRLLTRASPARQENAYLSIGERCNANGSKK